jgi:hypothetical protein
MIRREFAAQRQLFRVRLGHLALLVEASDEQRAIEEARRRMAEEWPRLWDLIQQAALERFQVEKL